MSAQASSSGPTAAAAAPPTQETLNALFDSGIWYHLSLWPALHVACANAWGGPETLEKKDWFAGAISDLLSSRPETDHEDLEEFLLNIMMDEFDTNVDDESEVEVARGILGLREVLVRQGDLAAFRDLESRWRNRKNLKVDVRVSEVVQDVDGEVAESEEWVDGDGDLEMDDGAAPNLVPVQPTIREKVEPEVDEDGFTKVVSKKKR